MSDARRKVREFLAGRGEKRKVERLTPPLQAILLDEITIAIRQLNQTVQSTIPTGETPGFLKDIGSTPVNVLHGYLKPWFNVILHNYGPNSVYWAVNEKPEVDPVHGDEMKIRETREVDMHSAKIKEVWCQCRDGERATIRVRGVY